MGILKTATPIIDDELWKLIEPLLPLGKPHVKSNPERPSVSDRGAPRHRPLLESDIGWDCLPSRLGFRSGARLDNWQKAGVWVRLHAPLLDKLRASGQFDLSHGCGRRIVRTSCRGGPGPGQVETKIAVQIFSPSCL